MKPNFEIAVARPEHVRTAVLVCAGLLIALAVLYMARTVVMFGRPKDFAYFWIAGQVWTSGGNPYLSGFSAAADAIAAATPEMGGLTGFHRWLYAPHIWGLSVSVSAFGFEAGRLLWSALGGTLLLAGTWLILAGTLDIRGRFFPLIYAVAAAATATTWGTIWALSVGQFAMFTYFGLAAFVYGTLRQHQGAVVLGLVILTMKPSIALPFVAVAMVVPALRVPLSLAGAIAAVLTVPALLADNPGQIAAGYLDGLAAYGGYAANAPFATTGLRNLAWYAAGLDVSGLWMSVASAVLAAIVARLSLRGGHHPDPVLAAPMLGLVIATTLFLVPLHTYDLTLAFGLLVLATSGSVILAVVSNLLVLFRVYKFTGLLGIDEGDTLFRGSFLSSVVLMYLFVLALALFIRREAVPAGAAR